VPVFYKLSSQGASNKPSAIDCTEIKIPKKDVAYRVEIPIEGDEKRVVYVLKPKIDKITLLFDGVSASDQETMPAWLWGLVEDPDDDQWANAPTKTSYGSKYKTNIVFAPIPGHKVLVQAEPKGKLKKGKKAPAFMRLEFNPAKLGADGMAKLKNAVEQVFADHVSFEKFLVASRVSRVDVACDLVNVATDEVVARSYKAGKSLVYHGKSGKLETAYFAVKKKKSSPQKIYNKARQLTDVQRQEKFPGIPHTRVESTIKTNIAVAKLAAIENPFLSLDVRFPTKSHAPEQPYVWQLFLDSCRFRGMDAALAQLPEPLRTSYKDALDATKGVLWKPADIWQGWPQVLAESGLG